VEQQLSLPAWITVENIAVFIRGYVHTLDPHLSVLDRTPTVFQIDAAIPYRLDLCSHKLDTTLYLLQHEIIVTCLSVVGNLLCAFFVYRHTAHLPWNIIITPFHAFVNRQRVQKIVQMVVMFRFLHISVCAYVQIRVLK
jgi:hypothetical protein